MKNDTPNLVNGSDDANVSHEVEDISRQLIKLYGLAMPVVEPMRVSSRNALYRVVSGDETWILKLFKIPGNYPANRIAEHARYEAQLIQALIERGFVTASIRPKLAGGLVSTIEDYPVILFEELPGTLIQRTDCPQERIVSSLAQIHAIQLEQPLEVSTEFRFDDVLTRSLSLFHKYRSDTSIDEEFTEILNLFAPLVEALTESERRQLLFARSPSVHCHGDVAPRNIIMDSKEKVQLFDFNYAFYGPRLVDVIDAAFQFSFDHFEGFDAFLDSYFQAVPLSDEEHADLSDWIALLGCLRLARELKGILNPRKQSRYKRYRERFHCISLILARRSLAG